MHLVLIGPRASGKSTLGRALAARLERPFVDLDDRALARTGCRSVVEAFALRGEASWREAEEAALAEALEGVPVVLALGGGTPTIPGAAARLLAARRAGAAVIILLRCPAGTLAARLAASPGDRPSLTGAAPAEEIAALAAQREPAYRAAASFEVDAAGSDPAATVERILGRLREGAPRPHDLPPADR